MVMKQCPKCKQWFSWDISMGPDYVHRCNSGQEALDQEPVQKIGAWEDYSGSGTDANVQTIGQNSTRASGKALIAGVKVHKKNVWGKIDKLYRKRQHYEHIDMSNEMR